MANSDRRDFLRRITTGAVVAGAGVGSTQHAAQAAEQVLVQRRTLGSTGAQVSMLGLGLGSAFTGAFGKDEDARDAVLQQALDMGVNYWDTANAYGPSQKMIGPMVEKNRDKIFLVSKTQQRTYDGFMKELTKTLTEARTDHLDLFHCHNLGGVRNTPDQTGDIKALADGCVKAALKAKEEGMIKHWGCTGHSNAQVLMDFVNAYEPECLMSVFPASGKGSDYEKKLLPLCLEKKMGVIAMKTVRQASQSDLKGSDLPRYALSLEGIVVANVGLDSIAHLSENVQMASASFKPLDDEEKVAMAIHMRIASMGLPAPWEVEGYQDCHPDCRMV